MVHQLEYKIHSVNLPMKSLLEDERHKNRIKLVEGRRVDKMGYSHLADQ